MEYTLASAAVAAAVNRSTILRAIKSGKVSARRLEDKSYRIDASELARVYPLQQPAQGAHEAMPEHAQGAARHAQGVHEPAQDAQVATEAAELRVEVRLLREQLDRERDTVNDLRRRLDQETEERRALQRQLAPPSPEQPQEAPAVVDDLRKRLEETEAWIAALTAPERPPEARKGAPKVSASRASRGFLARLLGRG